VERRDEVIVNGGALRRSRLVLRVVALAPIFLAPVACSRDVFDTTIELSSHAFTADFGAQSGTVPTVECDPVAPGVCGSGQVVQVAAEGAPTTAVSVSLGCDPASRQCYAQADASLAYELSVLNDDAFVTKVERRALTFVRVVDIEYALPVNTLTFDVARVDVFAGPSGSRVETDAGVVLIDGIDGVAAGQTIARDPSRTLTLQDDSPARSLIESSIRAQEPFVLIVRVSPRVEAGGPVPAGAFQVDLFPKIVVGLP
jgi:hypothetical protein